MPTKVKIKNFQSIGSTDFTIDGFTVIIGKNNIGKSAVVRSIDAALTNRSGKEFIRHGKKSTEVTIKREGLDVEWKKGSKTTYNVNGESYSALNRSVPQPLTDAGFRKLEVGSEKLNPLLAAQFDPLYLLNKTGSVITEALSVLYNLDVISSADDLCQKQLRATKSMLKTRTFDLTDIEDKVSRYEGFDEIKDKFQEVRVLQEKCNQTEQEINEIEDFEQRMESLKGSIVSLKKVKDVEIPEIADFDKQIGELDQLSTWEKNLNECARLVRGLKEAVNAAKGVEDISVENLEGLIEELKVIIDYEETFSQELSSARQARTALSEVVEKFEEIEKELGEFKVCPLCEKPL